MAGKEMLLLCAAMAMERSDDIKVQPPPEIAQMRKHAADLRGQGDQARAQLAPGAAAGGLAGDLAAGDKDVLLNHLTYDGQWENGKLHGEGVQKVPMGLRSVFDYDSYSGQWKEDKRHGKGEQVYGTNKKMYKYVGQFEEDRRVGDGKVYKNMGTERDAVGTEKEIWDLILNGKFTDDMVDTSEQKVWVHFASKDQKAAKPKSEEFQFEGLFYHGELGQSGLREGSGTLFDKDAGDLEGFLEKFTTGEAYKDYPPSSGTSNPLEGGTQRDLAADDKILEDLHIMFHGTWQADKYHGPAGVQHFRAIAGQLFASADVPHGTYRGEFKEGKRHGRGSWSSNGMLYRPQASMGEAEMGNWENDLMHGLLVAEDESSVHENVVFKDGRCQMPWMGTGPPKSGFEQALVASSKKVAPAAGGMAAMMGGMLTKAADAASELAGKGIDLVCKGMADTMDKSVDAIEGSMTTVGKTLVSGSKEEIKQSLLKVIERTELARATALCRGAEPHGAAEYQACAGNSLSAFLGSKVQADIEAELLSLVGDAVRASTAVTTWDAAIGQYNKLVGKMEEMNMAKPEPIKLDLEKYIVAQTVASILDVMGKAEAEVRKDSAKERATKPEHPVTFSKVFSGAKLDSMVYAGKST